MANYSYSTSCIQNLIQRISEEGPFNGSGLFTVDRSMQLDEATLSFIRVKSELYIKELPFQFSIFFGRGNLERIGIIVQ